jgi:hypothetical protein
MKKFVLDLSEYTVAIKAPKPTEEDPHAMAIENQPYPLKHNLGTWLRIGGIFKSGEEICEAITLAKAILACEDDKYILDEREAEVLKTCLNKHIALTEEGKTPMPLGGEIHEEAICRVFGMKETM